MLRNQAEGIVQEKDTMQSGLDDTLIVTITMNNDAKHIATRGQ
jgi:hypothetical protein